MSKIDISLNHFGVFGLGRSGIGVVKAATRRGAKVTVFDEKSEVTLPKPELLSEARALGAEVKLSWKGSEGLDEIDILVVNPSIPKSNSVIKKFQDQRRKVISEIEFAYLIAEAPIVAITGTNGKSSTTVMTWMALTECGFDAILCGNIYGTGYKELSLTNAADTAKSDQVLVAEISSFQLEFIEKFRPVCAGITNLSQDHTDRYNSVNEYYQTKLRLFKNMGENDRVVIQPDVLKLDKTNVIARSKARILTFGNSKDSDAKVVNNEMVLLGQTFPQFEFGNDHTGENASMAALLACGFLWRRQKMNANSLSTKDQQELETILAGISKFQGIAHRMEYLGEKRGVRVVNNSMCTNPAAVIRSIDSVKQSVHALIGGISKGADFNCLAQYLKTSPSKVYLFGQDAKVLKEILQVPGDIYGTMDQAFEVACHQAQADETIMLVPGCASQDQFRDFQHRGNVFREVAIRWLKS